MQIFLPLFLPVSHGFIEILKWHLPEKGSDIPLYPIVPLRIII